MTVRLIFRSFAHRLPARAAVAGALAVGCAVSAILAGMLLDVGDALEEEFSRYGANIEVVPAGDVLRAQIAGVELPLADGAHFLSEADLPRLERLFWRNNLKTVEPLLPLEAEVDGRPARVVGCRRSDVIAGRELGLEPGRTVRLRLGGRELDVRIAGIAPGRELRVPLAVAQTLLGRPGAIRKILIRAVTTPEMDLIRKGFDPRDLAPEDYERWMCTPYPSTIAHEIEKVLPGSAAAPVRRVSLREAALHDRLHGTIVFLLVLTAAASALAVAGGMTVFVLERRREFSVLRAEGAGPGVLVPLVLGEATLIGLAGGLLGCAAAALFAPRPAVLLFAALSALVVAVAGSALPLRSALSCDPARHLHEG